MTRTKALGTAAFLIGLLALAAGCGGAATATHLARPLPISQHAAPVDPVLARLHLPPLRAHSSPLPGYLLIADRDNNRIIIVNPQKQIVWRS